MLSTSSVSHTVKNQYHAHSKLHTASVTLTNARNLFLITAFSLRQLFPFELNPYTRTAQGFSCLHRSVATLEGLKITEIK